MGRAKEHTGGREESRKSRLCPIVKPLSSLSGEQVKVYREINPIFLFDDMHRKS